MRKIISLVIVLTFGFYGIAKAVPEGAQSSSAGGDFNKVGASGAQFLKIGIGARASGMGNAYGSIANDLTAIHWNPAGLAEIEGVSADFSYTQWFADFAHNFGAVSTPIGEDFTLAAHFISFSTDEIPVTTMNNPDGTGVTYGAQDISAGLSFAGFLTENFSFGVTGKIVYSGMKSLNSNGIAFDVGTKYNTGYRNLSLGFSIHNLGSEQSYSGQDLNDSKKLVDGLSAAPVDIAYTAYSFGVPISFRASLTGDIYDTEDHKLSGAFDFVTISDAPEQFAFGAEYVWHELLAIRAGYMAGHDEFGFGAGIGLRYFSGGFGGKLDYSINPSQNLGIVNRLSIGLNFGG